MTRPMMMRGPHDSATPARSVCPSNEGTSTLLLNCCPTSTRTMKFQFCGKKASAGKVPQNQGLVFEQVVSRHRGMQFLDTGGKSVTPSVPTTGKGC